MLSPRDPNALQDGWFVDRKVYTDPAVLEDEKQRIFYKTWHLACLQSDVLKPGDYFAMSIVDQPILIVRGRDNELRAFFNACTHRGAVLNNHRCGNERLFKCMYHAWAFNLEGELVGVPYEEGYGPDFDKSKLGLVPARVETFHDLVFVTVNPEAPPLIEYLGQLAPQIDHYFQNIEVIGRNSWIYEGNWKLWHENFRDNYHPQFAHRAINDAAPNYCDIASNWALEPGHSILRFQYQGWDSGKFVQSLQRRSGVPFDPAQRQPLFGAGEVAGGVRFTDSEVVAVFPNLDFQPDHFTPTSGGVGRAGFIQLSTPISVDRTRVDIIMYSSRTDSAQLRQAFLDNMSETQGSWGKVSADDTEAAVRCQAGLRGVGTAYSLITRGAKPGRGGEDTDGRDEYSLREFYRVYNQYMSGGKTPLAVAAE